MINAINNEAIELSADELDVVAGGATGLVEFANFDAEKTDIASLFTNGVNGTQSLTQISQQKVSANAAKAVFAS